MKKIIFILFVLVLCIFSYTVYSEINNNGNFKDEILCTIGKNDSCFNLGLKYLEKNNATKVDYDKALKLFKKSCDKGYALSCNNIGFLYQNGLTEEPNLEKALKYFNIACENNVSIGCSNLAQIHLDGEYRDLNRAARFYEKSCNHSDFSSCFNSVLIYQNNNKYEDAARLYNISCQNNNFVACNNLGAFYQNGIGVERDYNKTLNLYAKACNGGNFISCNNIAVLYQNGIGVEKNIQQAIDIYNLSCQNNESNACVILGDIFRDNKDGIEPNEEIYVNLYKKACYLGNQNGCDMLQGLITQANKKQQQAETTNKNKNK